MERISSSYRPVTLVIVSLLSLANLSCEKVVDIDWNSSEPHIVIEGSISDGSSCTVTLSTTVNYDETNTFPPVSGAIITLSDNVGNVDSLTEFHPGTYSGSTIHGTPGRTYTLRVSVGGKEYVAVSTMPRPVAIDTLTVDERAINGLKMQKVVNVYFHFPHNELSYFRIVKYRNSVLVKFISVWSVDDRGSKGGNAGYVTLTPIGEDTLRAGEFVQVNLECIDKGVYDYFHTIETYEIGIREWVSQTSSPANPVSNLSNGALGYFSAFSVRSSHITVP